MTTMIEMRVVDSGFGEPLLVLRRRSGRQPVVDVQLEGDVLSWSCADGVREAVVLRDAHGPLLGAQDQARSTEGLLVAETADGNRPGAAFVLAVEPGHLVQESCRA